jgi:hypothetical protein
MTLNIAARFNARLRYPRAKGGASSVILRGLPSFAFLAEVFVLNCNQQPGTPITSTNSFSTLLSKKGTDNWNQLLLCS